MFYYFIQEPKNSTPAYDFIPSFSVFADVVLLISCSFFWYSCRCTTMEVATCFFWCHYCCNNIMVHIWAIWITIHNNCSVVLLILIVKLFVRANLVVIEKKGFEFEGLIYWFRKPVHIYMEKHYFRATSKHSYLNVCLNWQLITCLQLSMILGDMTE